MKFSEYSKYDGLGLAKLVRDGEVTPLELVEACIERIDKVNPMLNAIIYRMDELGREAARNNIPDGPFRGVPFLLKDILAYYKGVPTSFGCRAFKDMPSPADSELVSRYKRAGLITLGKTNVPEFGLLNVTEPLLFGPTRNPWDTDRTSGGSSGGSAAAVAAGIVPIAHGNDGGGSIRIPAACCGLVGLKPTRARNPLGPFFGDLLSGLVCEHVLTRTVRDTAAMLDATAGYDPGDPYCAPAPRGRFIDAVDKDPGQLRVAYSTTDFTGVPLHEDCIAAVKKTASLCEDLGHLVEEGMPVMNNDTFTDAFGKLWCSEASSSIAFIGMFLGKNPSEDMVEPLTLTLSQFGSAISAADYLLAVTQLQMISRDIAKFYKTYDIWLAPVLGKPPIPVGTIDVSSNDVVKQMLEVANFSPYTTLNNATGQPAISLPLHWNDQGLPIGVQLSARFGEEETLLGLSAQLEQAAPWADKHPPI